MHLTLRQAEQRVFASKSTILRAIKSGKLSAERDGPEGSYRIEPSELFRAFPPKSADTLPSADLEVANATGRDPVAMVRITVENEKLLALLEVERRHAAELREDRDSWRAQAERLAIVHRATTANDIAPQSTQEPARRPNLLERIGRALKA